MVRRYSPNPALNDQGEMKEGTMEEFTIIASVIALAISITTLIVLLRK